MNQRSSRKIRIRLLMIALISALPIILSCFFYFVLKPRGGMSYGKLLQVKSVADTPLVTLDGQKMTLAAFRGKWLLVMVAGGACDAICQDRLFAIRQYRAGQGVAADRMDRMWIVNDKVTLNPAIPEILLAGVKIVRAQPFTQDLRLFCDDSIFLIDPQGHQVMQYQEVQDHRKIMNEIGKILKNNQWSG